FFMKKLALLTSGGDAPGMNACIRAVVRTALHQNIEVVGFRHGYEGLIHDEHIQLSHKSVANIIQRGGTILKTSRSQRFKTEEGLQLAANHLKKHNVDGLVVIGCDGTFTGAIALSHKSNVPIVGCPGTIDNDLVGTDFTIGYDTAINTVIDAVDKIRDTAESHDRVFIVEVMGRDAGLIALRTGIAAGAEAILIPESKTGLPAVFERLESSRKDKRSKIIMLAENGEEGDAFEIGRQIKERFPNYDTRISILGHIQRGGRPTCMDRVLASRVGVAAVEALMAGHRNEMVGLIHNEIAFTPFENAIKHNTDINADFLKIVEILAI